MRRYVIGFMIGISFISGISYASTGTIGGLFEKISGSWKLVGTNIKDGTIGNQQLGNNSVITSKILDKNVTETKLSDAIVAKLNAPIVTETDPTAVKLTGNQSIGGVKTFTNPVVGVTPTSNNHLTTKEYVDSAVSSIINCTFNSTTVLNGSSVTAYQNNIVTYPSGCISQTRTCTNGNLSGTYTNGTCTISYTYSWYSGSWGSCSVSCGGGNQYRTVSCQRNDGLTVSDSYCTGVKPSTSQLCNTSSCSPPSMTWKLIQSYAVFGPCGSSWIQGNTCYSNGSIIYTRCDGTNLGYFINDGRTSGQFQCGY